jgi:hypothetical protein
MYRYFLLFLLLSIYQTIYAQSRTRLVVFTENSERFWLVVNGQKINEQSASRVVAEDVVGETWQIKAIFENQQLGEAVHEGFKLVNDREQTYIIRKKHGKMRIKAFGIEKKVFSEMFRNGIRINGRRW